MNYLKQINTFFELLLSNPLSANAQCLYFNLLNINNKCNWLEEFTTANSTLMGFTNLNKQALYRARNELIQRNLIEFKKGINQNQSGKYKIIEFVTADNTANNTALDTAPDTADDTADDTNNKLNKTKQNNTSSKDDDTKKELKKHFELIWDIYPHKLGKAKAEEYFLKWVKGRKINGTTIKLTDKQMYLAVKKYKKECEDKQIEQQYIKYGDTFFNKAILDYVENG